MPQSQLPWWIALTLPACGAPAPSLLQRYLLQYRSDLPGLYHALVADPATPQLLRTAWETSSIPGQAHRLRDACMRLGIQLLVPGDGHYPERLSASPWFPPLLYLRGQLPPPQWTQLAVVGTRVPSPQGMELTRQCLESLRRTPVAIISGLAVGIDSSAHSASLGQGNPTLAVLGEGLEHLPSGSRRRLAEDILEAGGGLLSQFPPGCAPHKGCFPARNRTLAHLSDAVLLVESRLRGGAMNTASHALQANRPLYCLPGDPLRATSQGPHNLLRSGRAQILWEPQDLAPALGLRAKHSTDAFAGTMDAEHRAIWHLCAGEMLSLESLLARTQLPPQRLLAILTGLELEGVLSTLPGRHYRFRTTL